MLLQYNTMESKKKKKLAQFKLIECVLRNPSNEEIKTRKTQRIIINHSQKQKNINNKLFSDANIIVPCYSVYGTGVIISRIINLAFRSKWFVKTANSKPFNVKFAAEALHHHDFNFTSHWKHQ